MVPVSNHLMDTESDFAPWDLSKAHILVSSPVYDGGNQKPGFRVLKMVLVENLK